MSSEDRTEDGRKIIDFTARQPRPRARLKKPQPAVPSAPVAGPLKALAPEEQSRLCKKIIGEGEAVYIDDPQHGVVGMLLFFNPMLFEKSRPILKLATRIVTALWFFGWAGTLAATWATTVGAKGLDYPGIALITGMFMLGGTALWAAYVRFWLWPRDRFIVTDRRVIVVSSRFPFQGKVLNPLPVERILSINTKPPFWGEALGYETWGVTPAGSSDVIIERKFLRSRPELDRVREVLVTGGLTGNKEE